MVRFGRVVGEERGECVARDQRRRIPLKERTRRAKANAAVMRSCRSNVGAVRQCNAAVMEPASAKRPRVECPKVGRRRLWWRGCPY